MRRNRLFAYLKDFTEGFLCCCRDLTLNRHRRQPRGALCERLGALRACWCGRGMRGCPRGSSELFINTAKEEAYHAQGKKMPAKNTSEWFVWDGEDCLRSRSESGDSNGKERGFQSLTPQEPGSFPTRLMSGASWRRRECRIRLMDAARPRGSSWLGLCTAQGPANPS